MQRAKPDAKRLPPQRIHGRARPDVAASLHALAGVLQAQGDLPGAKEKLERSLRIEEGIYGTREHYLTAITEVNLAVLLLQQGEAKRGGELLLHAHETFLASLGPSHPSTRQVAELLQQLGLSR